MASLLAEYPDFKVLAQRMGFLVFPKNYHLREPTGRQARAAWCMFNISSDTRLTTQRLQ